MVDYGTDFDSTGKLDSKGQIATVSGQDNVKQAIRNRLLTELDTYIEWCDDYGSTLHDLFQRPLNENNIEWIKTEIKMTVLKEPRVASCEVEYTIGSGFVYRYRLIDDDNKYTENFMGVE
jgi:phage baseplate assembly protein W